MTCKHAWYYTGVQSASIGTPGTTGVLMQEEPSTVRECDNGKVFLPRLRLLTQTVALIHDSLRPYHAADAVGEIYKSTSRTEGI